MTLRIVAIAIAVSLITSLAVVRLSAPHTQQDSKKETAYERVIRTGVIRCGYINWMPVIARDANTGQMKGYWPQIMEAMAKAMELKIEWTEELNLGTYLNDLNNGRYDLECAAGWPNAVRGKFIYYTRPIVYSPLVPFVRADDTRFDSGIETLDQADLTAAVVDGDTSQIVRRERFPNMKELSLPQVASVQEYFVAVATGKADMTFSDYTGALDYLKNNPGKLKALPYQLRLVPQNIGVPQGDERMLNMLNTATLQLLSDGTIERILAAYDGGLKTLVLAKP
jgi:ABC-type amino acid transport substrate-binding protein